MSQLLVFHGLACILFCSVSYVINPLVLLALISLIFSIGFDARDATPMAIPAALFAMATIALGAFAISIYKFSKNSFGKLALDLKSWTCIFGIALIPFLRYAQYPKILGPHSFGGFDWHGYAISAAAIESGILKNPFPFYQTQGPLIEYFLKATVFGSYWPVALVHILTSMNWALSALATQFFAVFILFFVIFHFYKSVLGATSNQSLIMLPVIGINPYFNFLISEGYLSQIWGMVFTFALLTHIFKNKTYLLSPLRFWLPSLLLLTGLALNYSHMLPIVICILPLMLFENFKLKALRSWMLRSLAIIGILPTLLFLALPGRMNLILENFKHLKGVETGPGIHSQFAESWIGIHFSETFDKAPVVVELLISLLYGYVLILSISRAKTTHYKIFGPAILLGIAMTAVLMKLQNTPSLNYKTFKLISFFLPVLLFYFWNTLLNEQKYKRMAYGLIGIILAFNLINLFSFSQTILLKGTHVFPEIAALEDLPDVNQRISIIAPNRDYFSSDQFNGMMAGVFLSRNRLTFWSRNGFFLDSSLQGDKALVLGLKIENQFIYRNFTENSECLYQKKIDDLFYSKISCGSIKATNSREFVLKKSKGDLVTEAISLN